MRNDPVVLNGSCSASESCSVLAGRERERETDREGGKETRRIVAADPKPYLDARSPWYL